MIARHPKTLLLIAALAAAVAVMPLPEVGTGGTGKIRVLIVEKTTDRASIPKEQLAAYTGSKVMEYLGSHCLASGDDGGHHTVDVGSNLEAMPEWVKSAFEKAKAVPPPSMVVVKGSKSYVSAVPKGGQDAMLATLSKYGGK